MPNSKVIIAAEERRQARAAHAQRVYNGYAVQVKQLTHQLAGPSRGDHDRALRLLNQMSFLIVPDLLNAIVDPALDKDAVDEVVSLLGDAGDCNACQALWQHFHAVSHEPERASQVALSLAKLGDPLVLPYLREGLESGAPEQVMNAIQGMRFVGELEDFNRLRVIHRTCLDYGDDARDIRKYAVNAILAILEEAGSHTSDRLLDQIRNNFADRALWKDISAFTEFSYDR